MWVCACGCVGYFGCFPRSIRLPEEEEEKVDTEILRLAGGTVMQQDRCFKVVGQLTNPSCALSP